jgi:hypothetical protein
LCAVKKSPQLMRGPLGRRTIMEIMRDLPIRYPRATWFLLGVVLSAASNWLLAHWLPIANEWLGLQVIYDTRPSWLRITMTVLGWLPGAVLLVLIVLRWRFGPAVRPFAYAAGAASAHLALVGFVLLSPTIENRTHRERFTPAGWLVNGRTDIMWPTRLRMIDDLVARHDLTGLSRDSALALLGPADSTDYWKDWDAVYHLGPERGLMRIDSEWLVLRFSGDRVTEWRIVRD